MDRGVEGVKVTLDAMDAAGLGHSGTARTPEEATPQVFEVKGVKIAQLAYTFGSNLGTPPGQKWRLNISNPAAIVADARRARALGAQLVVVTIEWGDDQIVDPTPEQRRIAAAITASHDIDLIVGYQAHVLQPISKVNGTWVVWGMGNFISDHPVSSNWPASSQDGAIFTVDVTVDDNGAASVGKPLVIPTWCDRTNRHVILPTYLSRSDTLPAWKRQQLELSAKRTARVVGDHIAPGS
jgi:poly-gamma-glutamate synthesis protein (capsule biosynthesis protein)